MLKAVIGTSAPAPTQSSLVGRASAIFSAVATGTTLIPADNSIPQSTEGDQYMTLSYTPSNTSHVLEIDVAALVTANAATTITLALFQGDGTDAIAATSSQITTTGQTQSLGLTWTMAAGTTSSTTFTVRMGASSTATTTFNGAAGVQRYNGVAASQIRIHEYTA